MRTTDERPSWVAFTTVCVLCGVFFGMGLARFLRNRRPKKTPAKALAGASSQALPMRAAFWDPSPTTWLTPKAAPKIVEEVVEAPIARVIEQPQFVGSKTMLATVTLSDSTTHQIMMAANERPWAVQVSVIGPPGAFAAFGHDSNTVAGNMNANGVLVVAAGTHRDLYLSPGEYLYARGSLPNTMVSISAKMVDA